MEPFEYLHALNTQLTYLFAYARKINETDTAAALLTEFRGAQDAGWTTVITAHEVFDELKTLGSKGGPLTRPELRQVLCLYAQLAEAGGLYEGLLNTMQVVQLKAYNLWPFKDLVRVRQTPRAVIGPNANKMFRHLAEVATAIGMTNLARLLEVTFRDDIRNGMAHADYVLAPDGLRLRRRNGGHPVVVSYDDIMKALQIALFFFELLHAFQLSVAESFRPARTIIGRLSANPPMAWKIELTEDGRVSISSERPGPQIDAAFERQQLLNDKLGGHMVAAYAAPTNPVPLALLRDILAIGFDVLVVDLVTTDQLDALIAEVERYKLWDQSANLSDTSDAVLMVTPMGFRRIATGADFLAWLPVVESIQIG